MAWYRCLDGKFIELSIDLFDGTSFDMIYSILMNTHHNKQNQQVYLTIKATVTRQKKIGTRSLQFPINANKLRSYFVINKWGNMNNISFVCSCRWSFQESGAFLISSLKRHERYFLMQSGRYDRIKEIRKHQS